MIDNLENLKISDIAFLVFKDWKNIYFGAAPYLDAMAHLEKISDNYFADSGKSVVSYFLANAQTWKGEVAKEIKKELNRRLKAK